MQQIGQYRTERGPFVGCPLDAHKYALALLETFASLPALGVQESFYYWARDYDKDHIFGSDPDQHRIQRTSSQLVNPIFILFKGTIGSPAPPPSEGWQSMRQWLNDHGFSYIALLGESNFTDAQFVPSGCVPLTGTLYEMFDALRDGNTHKTIRIFHITDGIKTDDAIADEQYAWLKRVLSDLKARYESLITEVDGLEALTREASRTLKSHVGFSRLDPLVDPMPGLQALRHPALLPARQREVDALQRLIDHDESRITLVNGVSGSGKSSLLDAGLLGCWFPSSDVIPEENRTVLLIEPIDLIDSDDNAVEDNEADPFPGLAQAFTGPNLYPHSLPTVSTPPAFTGDEAQYWKELLAWWRHLTDGMTGSLVIILDDIEQIGTTARRAARALSIQQNQSTANPVIGPGWNRLMTFLLTVTGYGGAEESDPILLQEIAQSHPNLTVKLVLGAREQAAIEDWPLASIQDPSVFTVEPLSAREDFTEVIDRIMATYGLTLEEELRQTMINEAVSLASTTMQVETHHQVASGNLPERAYVLPQLVVTLGRLIEHWASLRRQSDSRKQSIDWTLSTESYASLARIEDSIDKLGESVWEVWQQHLIYSMQPESSSYLGMHKVERVQKQEFARLFQRLIDAQNPDDRQLVHLRRDSTAARVLKEPISILLNYRLMTDVGGRYLRLPHRAILDCWYRARLWSFKTNTLLEIKHELRSQYWLRKRYPEPTWKRQQLINYLMLVEAWVGTTENEDEALYRWVIQSLVRHAKFKRVSVYSISVKNRIPLMAFHSDDLQWRDLIIKEFLTNAKPLYSSTKWGRQVLQFLSRRPTWLKIAYRLYRRCSGFERSRIHLSLQAAAVGSNSYAKALINDSPELAKYRVLTRIRYVGMNFLETACVFGATESLDYALSLGVSPDEGLARNKDTPLIRASAKGNTEIVRRLLKASANPCRINTKDGDFPLLSASHSGYTDIALALLKAGADVNQVDKAGLHALVPAAQNGHSELVRLLLNAGAEPVISHVKSELSALEIAAQNGYIDIVKQLIDAGADIDHTDTKTGSFALFLAAQQGQLAIVNFLLSRGATVNKKDAILQSTPLLQAAQDGHSDIVARLVEHGADIEQTHENGTFPLMLAIDGGHRELVCLCLALGADPDQNNSVRDTFPLLQAVRGGEYDIVAELINHSASSVNRTVVKNHDFPLLVAASKGRSDIAKLLLDAGANPNLDTGPEGGCALEAASLLGHTELVRTLMQYGAEVRKVFKHTGSTALQLAASTGSSATCLTLIYNGADVNWGSHTEHSFPLWQAVILGHHETAEILIQRGASVHQRHQDYAGSLYSLAASNLDYKTCRVLLRAQQESSHVVPLLTQQIEKHEKTAQSRSSRNTAPINFVYPVPGEWKKLSSSTKSLSGFVSIFEDFDYDDIDLTVDKIKSICRLENPFHEQLSIYRLDIVVSNHKNANSIYVFHATGFPVNTVRIDGYIDMHRLVEEYQSQGIYFDLTEKNSINTFLALWLRTKGIGRFFIPEQLKLNNEDALYARYSENESALSRLSKENWRQWTHRQRHLGVEVEIPVFKGSSIIRETFFVAHDGLGMKVMSDAEH